MSMLSLVQVLCFIYKVINVAEGVFPFAVLWCASHLSVSRIQFFFVSSATAFTRVLVNYRSRCRVSTATSGLERACVVDDGCHYCFNIHILSEYIVP